MACVLRLLGCLPAGHVAVVVEGGRLWVHCGYTRDTAPAGPSRRVLNPYEALYMVQRSGGAAATVVVQDAEGAPLPAPDACALLLACTDARVFVAYTAMRAQGYVVRFARPHAPSDELLLHFAAAGFKLSDPPPPDSVLRVCRSARVIV
jgi:hypothetical protein